MKYTLLIILTKVGEGIQKLKLKNDLRIEAIKKEDISTKFNFLKKSNGSSFDIMHYMWENNALNSKNNKVYIITKLFDLEEENSKNHLKGINEFGAIQKELISGYIDLLITKLRLFKGGNVGYLNYHFYTEDGTHMWTGNSFATEWGIDYELVDEKEIEKCNYFLENINLPHDGRLKIAIDNFNQSYNKILYELQFMSLMMTMESLYSKNPVEATFRLTRNCAIFISETKDEAEAIYNDFNRLYKMRSHLIHGRIKGIEYKEVLTLREYVRRSIVRYLLSRKNSDAIIEELDKLGFGDYNKI